MSISTDKAYIAVRQDGFVDGACLTESEDARSWCLEMAKSGFTVLKRDREEARRLVSTHIFPPRSVAACGVPSLGMYEGRPIPAWIETGDGWCGEFYGVCGSTPDLRTLPGDCRIIAPGLMYRPTKKHPPSHDEDGC